MSRKNKTPDRIRFYAVRDAGENINATLDFARQSWREVLRLTSYVLVPLSIVQGMGINNLLAAGMTDVEFSWASATLAALCTLLGAAVCTAMTIALIEWYSTHDDGLRSATAKALAPIVWHYTVKSLLVWIVNAAIMVPGIIVSGAIGLFLLFVPLLAFLGATMSLWLIAPVYILEQKSYRESFARAFRLGKVHWWQLAGMGFTLWITIMVVYPIASVPYSIGMIMMDTFGHNSSALEWKMFTQILTYALSILECFVLYIGNMLFAAAFTYYYGSIGTEVDHVNILADIDNFENL